MITIYRGGGDQHRLLFICAIPIIFLTLFCTLSIAKPSAEAKGWLEVSLYLIHHPITWKWKFLTMTQPLYCLSPGQLKETLLCQTRRHGYPYRFCVGDSFPPNVTCLFYISKYCICIRSQFIHNMYNKKTDDVNSWRLSFCHLQL